MTKPEEKEYEVRHRYVRQIAPAVAGTRSVWREDLRSDNFWVMPVLVWVRFRTKIEWRVRPSGEVVSSSWDKYEYGSSIGGIVQADMGTQLCESSEQFVGYLAPGEELTDEWWRNAGFDPPKKRESPP